jgi:hypothetical protein
MAVYAACTGQQDATADGTGWVSYQNNYRTTQCLPAYPESWCATGFTFTVESQTDSVAKTISYRAHYTYTHPAANGGGPADGGYGQWHTCPLEDVVDKCSKNPDLDAALGNDFVTDTLTKAGAQSFQQLGITGGYVCYSGCKVALNKSNVVCGGKAGAWTCTAIGGIGAKTGTNCDGSGPSVPTTSGAERPAQMKPGTCPGEVNGVTVYVACDSSSTSNAPSTTDSTTSNSDGSSSSGSSSDSSNTECSNGSCTTTKTSTDSDGKTTTTSTTETQDSYCKSNPTAAICKAATDSTFSGSCGAAFSCDGDAIQCAIAQDQHARNCALFDTASAESELYGTEKGKTGDQTTALAGNETRAIGSIDTSDALGGARCVSDLNITVMGRTATLPLSTVCPQLALLGQVLVAISFLLAIRIVTRG